MVSRREAGKSEATPEPVFSLGKPACRRNLSPGAPRTHVSYGQSRNV